jgi:hypothetical protein
VDRNSALVQCEQAPLAQLAQNAVDVDGGQTQRVGEDELAERAFELGHGRQSHQAGLPRDRLNDAKQVLDAMAELIGDEAKPRIFLRYLSSVTKRSPPRALNW